MTFRRWKFVRFCVCRGAWRTGTLLVIALGTLAACGTAALDGPGGHLEPTDPNDVLESAPAPIALTPLTVHTYDGSGEFVHPDAFVFPAPWHGRRFWFSATPYPGGRIDLENPSLFHATNAVDWDAPAGVANPLARADANSYLSDPDLEHDPVLDELRLYFRQTTGVRDELFVVTSGDGRRWSPRRSLLSGRRYSLISPAVVREPSGKWRLWTVDPGDAGCRVRRADVVLSERRSTDGLTWGAPAPVALEIPGYVPWHWDVQYIPAKHEYWTVVAAYPDAMNCSFTSVFFGRSADGTSWRMSPTPLLAPGTLAPLRNLVYRSTFHYHERSDAVSVWFSGARLESGIYVYGGATARYPMAELLQHVERSFDVGASVRRTRHVSTTHADSVARTRFVSAFP